MDEVLADFLGECYENLEKLDNELVMLEKGTDPTQLHRSISNVFRMVHTINNGSDRNHEAIAPYFLSSG